MIFSDTIIEKKRIFLRNLNINALNDMPDVWTNATAAGTYNVHSFNYEIPLGINKYYYVRFDYKFTTTNQSPTWATFYLRNGSLPTEAKITNPVAGIEYTASTITLVTLTETSMTYGSIYNGVLTAINGVSALVRNVITYDVTELYDILKQACLATTTTDLKTWCDINLICSPRYTNYDITDLLGDALTKVVFTKGTILADLFIEPEGMDFYVVNNGLKNNKFFDNFTTTHLAGCYCPSFPSTGTKDYEVVAEAKLLNSPFYEKHPNILKITTNHTSASGRMGGLDAGSTGANANKRFLTKMIAKIPTGYTITFSGNNTSGLTYLSSRAGTDDWQEYCFVTNFTGTNNVLGHCYLTGPSFTGEKSWYVAFYCIYNIIDHEELKNFTILPNLERIKEGNIYSTLFNNLNLILPTHKFNIDSSLYTYDYEDYAGDSNFSIVYNIGSATYKMYPDKFIITPGLRYKFSCWIKCKQDMTSFLIGIRYYTADDTLLEHKLVHFVNGTRTKLALNLNTGDTIVKVVSNANWIVRSSSNLGFRSNISKSYNDLGTFGSSIVSGISGSDTINLNTAYTGTTIPKDKYIVEGYSGSTYYYPVAKTNLPIDNTWKYIETYFGLNSLWFGNVTSGSWLNIPVDTAYARIVLDLYANDGSVPIKYSDIKIEPVLAGALARNEQKIQIIGG